MGAMVTEVSSITIRGFLDYYLMLDSTLYLFLDVIFLGVRT